MKRCTTISFIYFRFQFVFLLILLSLSLPFVLEAQQLAEGKDKFLGAASSGNVYRNFYKFWNQITPGNDGKWQSVEPARDQLLWTNLDKIYNYSRGADIPFKEHALIWGQQAPGWITQLSTEEQRAEIEEWFQAIGERYPEMEYVDVVNEPFNAPPAFAGALGGNGATGWDWVITSFELARQYCPNAKLILNEYNVLHSDGITTNYLTIINLLKDRNLIDGIGIQGHYFEFRSDISGPLNYVHNIQTIKNNLNRLTNTGIPVYITEFDIDEPVDNNQLEQYKIYFPIFWENPDVKGITLWGYIQNDVWNSHPNTYLLRTDGSERPALQWLRNYILSPLPPVSLSAGSGTVVSRNPILTWQPSDSTASSYRIQISSGLSFTSLVIDTTITDTLIQIDSLEENSTFYWRVSAVNEYGESSFSENASFVTNDQIVAVTETGVTPAQFYLFQNYPNPFNPTTKIAFSVPQSGEVSLVVYDVLGNIVAELVNGTYNSGSYEVTLNASSFASGAYFYKLKAGDFISIKKLILMK